MAAVTAPASAATDSSSQWDDLRREARRLEGDLDVRLSAYAKLGGYSEPRAGAVTDQLHGGAQQWRSVEMEIESLLEKLLDVNEAMSRCSAAAAAPSLSVNQKLTRHRDILHEFSHVPPHLGHSLHQDAMVWFYPLRGNALPKRCLAGISDPIRPNAFMAAAKDLVFKWGFPLLLVLDSEESFINEIFTIFIEFELLAW